MSDSFDNRMTVGEVESRISRQIEKFADIPEFGSCDDFMKEKSYFKGVPPNLPPKGSRCDGCPYWHGIGCVFCYREQLKPKMGEKNEP